MFQNHHFIQDTHSNNCPDFQTLQHVPKPPLYSRHTQPQLSCHPNLAACSKITTLFKTHTATIVLPSEPCSMFPNNHFIQDTHSHNCPDFQTLRPVPKPPLYSRHTQPQLSCHPNLAACSKITTLFKTHTATIVLTSKPCSQFQNNHFIQDTHSNNCPDFQTLQHVPKPPLYSRHTQPQLSRLLNLAASSKTTTLFNTHSHSCPDFQTLQHVPKPPLYSTHTATVVQTSEPCGLFPKPPLYSRHTATVVQTSEPCSLFQNHDFIQDTHSHSCPDF